MARGKIPLPTNFPLRHDQRLHAQGRVQNGRLQRRGHHRLEFPKHRAIAIPLRLLAGSGRIRAQLRLDQSAVTRGRPVFWSSLNQLE